MDNDDLIHRLQNLLGVDMTAKRNGPDDRRSPTDVPKGIVATNADGTAFGMAEILLKTCRAYGRLRHVTNSVRCCDGLGVWIGTPRHLRNSASSAAWVR